jgi:cob(I)alamin adenosyltransferase
MGKRLSKIYTRTGDSGETGLGDGSRAKKDSSRIHAIGSIDELNSWIGLVVEQLNQTEISTLLPTANFLRQCQHRIFDLGGEVSIPGYQIITAEHVEKIESELDSLNQHLQPLENFILPGGSELIAQTHLARSICRRAERDLVTLQNDPEQSVNSDGLKFLNRLSDYLFVLARYVAREQNIDEVLWQKG